MFVRRLSALLTFVLVTLLALAGIHAAPASAAPSYVVNGHALGANEIANVRWIASTTYAGLKGTRDQRLDALASVAWWSLKEGLLGLPQSGATTTVFAFNNCHDDNTGLDTRLGPTGTCASRIWQVGMAGIQVRNFDSRYVPLATDLYPGQSVDQVLQHTLSYSGYATTSTVARTVMADRGLLRLSWLARNHRIAFTLQAPQVQSECFTGSAGWCYGSGWTATTRFAPTKTAAVRARAELRAIFAELTSGTATPAPTPTLFQARVLDTGGVSLNVRQTPSLSAAVVGSVSAGQTVGIKCQATGPQVHNDIAGYTSTLWDYLPDKGGYVSDAWIHTGYSGRIPGVPAC